MPIRPRTNSVTRSSNTCCEPVAPLDCSRYEPFMGPSSAAVKRVRIEDGDCLRVMAYVIPGGITVTIYAVDGGECASDLRTPLVRCGAPVVIDNANRATTLCGPGWFEFQSSGVAGSVLLQAERHEGADQPCGGTSVAPTPCSIGAVVPTGVIAGFVLGIDSNGCLVKQATETVELRDCNNVLLYSFRALASPVRADP